MLDSSGLKLLQPYNIPIKTYRFIELMRRDFHRDVLACAKVYVVCLCHEPASALVAMMKPD
tara:strand:- start:553 stop:735 length:183 start_codon:yes stop_codon:yes gene_type:complete